MAAVSSGYNHVTDERLKEVLDQLVLGISGDTMDAVDLRSELRSKGLEIVAINEPKARANG